MAEAEFAALAEANIRLKRPFKLATGGWELGPEDDRSRFDRTIGPECKCSRSLCVLLRSLKRRGCTDWGTHAGDV